jgi:Lrp/AsnC family leucine-responsive transcriptional regulator
MCRRHRRVPVEHDAGDGAGETVDAAEPGTVGHAIGQDDVAVGFGLSAVIRVRPAPRQLHRVAEVARTAPEVVGCRRITGEDCYVMTAHLRSVEHLEEVIDRFTVYGQTTTSIVQSSPVPPRGLPLDAGT